jgi:hypothetical protein
MLEREGSDIVVVPERNVNAGRASRAAARVLECPSHQAKL